MLLPVLALGFHLPAAPHTPATRSAYITMQSSNGEGRVVSNQDGNSKLVMAANLDRLTTENEYLRKALEEATRDNEPVVEAKQTIREGGMPFADYLASRAEAGNVQ